MNENEEKKRQDFEMRLTSNEGDVVIIDENGKKLKQEDLRNEALKKLKKYQEEQQQNNANNDKI